MDRQTGYRYKIQALVKGELLDKRLFTAEELFHTSIKFSVAGQTAQTPVYSIIRNSGHEGGEFVFIKR
jgi:hypothetical protein